MAEAVTFKLSRLVCVCVCSRALTNWSQSSPVLNQIPPLTTIKMNPTQEKVPGQSPPNMSQGDKGCLEIDCQSAKLKVQIKAKRATSAESTTIIMRIMAKS